MMSECLRMSQCKLTFKTFLKNLSLATFEEVKRPSGSETKKAIVTKSWRIYHSTPLPWNSLFITINI